MTTRAESDDLAIDLRDVAKVYKGKVHALAGIEMRVRRGEVFGLLGPNGAGKSTLVKIMMTVIRPTRADGTLLGRPVGDKATLRRVGYLPESHRFPRYLTGRQTIEFFAALQGVDRAARRRRAGELLETVGMTDWGDRKVATYSKGMMQRVGLAQALAADPDLVVLDEPTDGVDPVGRRDIRDVLGRIREQGKTVFINSHLLSELEMICDRLAILVKGTVAKQGTLDELTRGQQRYEIEVAEGDGGAGGWLGLRNNIIAALGGTWDGAGGSSTGASGAGATPAIPYASARPGGPPPMPGSIPPVRGTLPGGTWAEIDGPTLRIGTIDPVAVQPTIDLLRAAGLTLRRVSPFRQSLEDLFIESVTDPATGQALTPGAARPGGPRFAPAQPSSPFQQGGRR